MKIIKSIYLLPVLFAFLLFLFSCNKVIIGTSRWQENALKIDGSADDWNNTDSLLYDVNTHVLYNVSNDHKNLYICLKIADPQSQMKILRRGLTFWIDTTGKNKKNLGIRFPLGGGMRYHKMPAGNTENKGNLNTDIKTMKKILISEQREFEMIGFTLLGYEKKESMKASLFASAGIKIAIGIDTLDYLIYEMAVPLNYLYKSPSTTLNSEKMILSIGLESNSTNSSGNSPDGKGSNNGMHSGGGMHTGGGGMHNGGMHSGEETQSRDSEPIKTWIKIKLANQK